MQIKGTRDSKIGMLAISSVLNKYYYCLTYLSLGIFLYRMGGIIATFMVIVNIK